MKKLLILLLVLGSFFVVSCGQTTEYKDKIIRFDEQQTKPTVLTVWMDDSDSILADEIIPAFQKANPGIIVEFQHMATVDSREKLKTYGQAGYGADVFQFPHDHMAQAILDDLVYVLPDGVKDRLEERILPVAMDIATAYYNEDTKSFEPDDASVEKLFAVPISIESVFLFYNKALVTEEQLPATFEQLLEDAKAYQEAHDGKKYFASSSHWADGYFNQFIYSAFGWTPFGPNLNDKTEVGFEKETLRNGVQFLIEKVKPVTTGNGNHDSIQGAALFQEGELPFLLTGPWGIPDIKKANVDYGAMVLPTVNNQPTKTYAGAQMLAVYKYSRNVEAAIKFVEYMASDEAAEILYRTSGDCPALKDDILANIPGISEDEGLKVMLQQLSTSVPMPTIPQVTYYWAPEETMMKNLWNMQGDIDEQLAQAEISYQAARDLAEGK